MSQQTVKAHRCDFCKTYEIDMSQVQSWWTIVNGEMEACDKCTQVLCNLAVMCEIPTNWATYDYNASSLNERQITIDFSITLTSGEVCKGVIEALVFMGLISPINKIE